MRPPHARPGARPVHPGAVGRASDARALGAVSVPSQAQLGTSPLWASCRGPRHHPLLGSSHHDCLSRAPGGASGRPVHGHGDAESRAWPWGRERLLQCRVRPRHTVTEPSIFAAPSLAPRRPLARTPPVPRSQGRGLPCCPSGRRSVLGAWGVIWQRPAGGRERTREDGDGPVGRDAGGTYSDTDERRTSVRVSRGRRRSAGP